MDLAPYSGAIEAATNFGNAIVSRIWPDKTKVAEMQTQLAELIKTGEFNVQLAEIQSVNATMQAEAKSEKWPQYSWRPAIGFTFAAILVNNYVLLAYLRHFGVVPLDIPSEVWTAFLVILGAASAGRSFEKWKGTNGG